MKTNLDSSNNEEIKKIVIAQSNKLTLSKQEMSIGCRRLMYLVIYKIRTMNLPKEQTDDMIPINMSITLDEMKRYKIASKTNVIFRILDEMGKYSDKNLSITYKVADRGKIKYIHTRWILEFIYSEEVLMINISGMFVNLVNNLKNNFTMFNPLIPLSFKKITTQRFFELCHMFKSYHIETKKYPRISIDELLYMFGLENNESYKRNFFDLKKRVIDPAQEELFDLFDKNKSDVCFKYDKIKENGIQYIELRVIVKNQNELFDECNNRIANATIKLISKYIKNNDVRMEKLRTYILSLNRQSALLVKKKIENKINEYKTNNKENNYNKDVIAKVLSTILKVDYDI